VIDPNPSAGEERDRKMPLKPLGRPPYLLPDEVENDDVLEIIEKPYIVPAEKTKWGKERGKAVVKVLRTGTIRTWTMNNTTWDKLIQAYGEDAGQWLNKKVQIRKEARNVNGVDKTVLYGKPYHEPQQQLDPQPLSLDAETLAKLKALAPDEKQALLKALSTA